MAPSSMSERLTTPSKAGITVTPDGQRIIPSSIRADGSARREIRVRPGYRPPEDVEIYKNRSAEAWKNRGSGGVPGAAPAENKPEAVKTEASNKNAKRKARRRAKETEAKKEGEVPKPTPPPSKELDAPTNSETPAADKEKTAKSIRKKIRQANELKSRREGGETLLPEQLEKVIKMNELVRQLNALGFEQ